MVVHHVAAAVGAFIANARAALAELDWATRAAGLGFLVILLAALFGAPSSATQPAVALAWLLRRTAKVCFGWLLPREKSKAKPVVPPVPGRRVTVFAEAAFSRRAKAGAWAVFGKSGEPPPLRASGVFHRHKVHTLDHAHVEAVSEAITQAVAFWQLGAGDILVVYGSSEHAVAAFNGKALRENARDEADAVARAGAVARSRRVCLLVRHIHENEQRNLERRNLAAEICEREAGEVLSKHLAEKKEATP